MLRMFLAGSILDYVTVLEWLAVIEQVFESNEAAKSIWPDWLKWFLR